MYKSGKGKIELGKFYARQNDDSGAHARRYCCAFAGKSPLPDTKYSCIHSGTIFLLNVSIINCCEEKLTPKVGMCWEFN